VESGWAVVNGKAGGGSVLATLRGWRLTSASHALAQLLLRLKSALVGFLTGQRVGEIYKISMIAIVFLLTALIGRAKLNKS
jgi:hypothetical protein